MATGESGDARYTGEVNGSARGAFAHPRSELLSGRKRRTDMIDPANHTRRAFVLTEAVAFLARTPAALGALLKGLPDGWVVANEGGETWSPVDVISHLIHGEQTDWLPRVKIILESGEARPFDKFDRFAQLASKARSLPDLLDEFAMLRQDSLAELAALNLAEPDLDRVGRHPELGVVTLRQLLATWVAHDLDHIVQVARIMARQYSDEVGPWRAYLRIISGTQG
jgi:hypothetical protein